MPERLRGDGGSASVITTSRKTAGLAIVPFLMAAALWWLRPHIAYDTDSFRYLTASPMRTATYPLFLRALNGPALLPLQLFLFAAALAWLAFYSTRFLPWIVAAAMVLAIAANPYIWQLQGTVMSEALTTPLLVLVVGCIVGFAATGQRSLLVAAALICGVATTARPSLVPMVVTPLCAAWIAPKLEGRAKLSALILLAFATPVAVERLYAHLAYGSAVTSPMGRQLFMKAAVIDAPATPASSGDPVDQTLARELNDEYAPVRQLLHRTTDRDIRWILLTNYEGCASYSCFTGVWNQFHVPEAELHRRLFAVAARRLEANPVGYLELTASDYLRMWFLHQRKVPTIAPKYNAFLAREMPLPFQTLVGEEGQPTPAAQQKSILRANRAAFALVGILAAAMSIGFVFWRRGPLAQAALSLLLGSQAVLVLSAFVGSGLVRYTMGMWPTIIAAEALGVAALLAAWNPQLLARPAPQKLRAA